MNYFIQTQPPPDEGAHAREVSLEDFATACGENPYVQIEGDGVALWLRFDLPLLETT